MASLLIALVEAAQAVRHVDRVGDQNRQGDDVECSLVCGREHHEAPCSVEMCAQPVRGRDTPPISRFESRKVKLRHGGDEIVANSNLMLEKLHGHDSTDCVAPEILFARRAAPVSIEAGQRIKAARLELFAQDVAI